MNMANRDDTKDQSRAADEAARTARTVTDEAARVGEQTARAGADIVNRSTETARNVVEAGLNTATQTFQRATDQLPHGACSSASARSPRSLSAVPGGCDGC